MSSSDGALVSSTQESFEQYKAEMATAKLNSERRFHQLEQKFMALRGQNEVLQAEAKELRQSASDAEKRCSVLESKNAMSTKDLSSKEREVERLVQECRENKDEKDALLARVSRLLEEERSRNAELKDYIGRVDFHESATGNDPKPQVVLDTARKTSWTVRKAALCC